MLSSCRKRNKKFFSFLFITKCSFIMKLCVVFWVKYRNGFSVFPFWMRNILQLNRRQKLHFFDCLNQKTFIKLPPSIRLETDTEQQKNSIQKNVLRGNPFPHNSTLDAIYTHMCELSPLCVCVCVYDVWFFWGVFE